MTPHPGRNPTARATALYLVLLPSAHLIYLPVAGAVATGADVFLLLLVVVAAVELLATPDRLLGLVSVLRGERVEGLPAPGYLRGALVLAGLGVWIAASGSWGFHPRYAVAKGLGTGALALGVLTIAAGGLGRRQAADAWLLGAALALGLALVLGLAGPEALRDRVVYGAGGVTGLPFPRLAGPLIHPNMMGDYLVVSGVLLWGRWPGLSPAARRWAPALALALGVGLFLTASTAWIAAGVALALVGRRRGSRVLRALGVVLAAGALVATLVPAELRLAGMEITTSGLRPQIWQASLYPIVEAPLLGVGASPYLAEAVDPLTGTLGLWDAHNVVLSLLGQFGLVGLALAVWGLRLLVRGSPDADADRVAAAVRIALVCVGVHALFVAAEDLRHVWALLGIAGAVGVRSQGSAEG